MKNLLKIAFLLFVIVILFCSCDEGCQHENLDVIVTDPTCVDGGYTTYTCLDCAYFYTNNNTAPNGHSFKSTAILPSCDEQGFTENVCACGYSYLSSYIAPLGHDFVESKIAADCNKRGYTLHLCKNCQYKYIDSYISVKDHVFSESVIEPDCTSQGYTIFTCECGYAYSGNYVAPTDHTFTQETVLPDCISQGYTLNTCSCGYEYKSDYTPTTDHIFTEKVISPTCEESGYTQYSCLCGFSFNSDFTVATGHTLDKQTIEPTCVNNGYSIYSCVCGFTYISDYTIPKGHRYTGVITKPTCISAGYTTNQCECGYTLISDYISTPGHQFEKKITMPTVSDMGYTEYFCTVCSFSYKGNYRFYSEILPNGAYSSSSTVIARGIDISKWNHSVNSQYEFMPLDWNAIKDEGVDYVILKAGSTISGKESTFDLDYKGAKLAGLDVGVYFYTYATNVEEIKADAKLLLSILDGKQFEYPIYLDLEDDSLRYIEPSILTEMCMVFFTTLQEHGYYTGLYVNHDWLYNILQTEKMLDLFDIWYARYPEGVTEYVWDTEEYGEHLGMWQYTSEGRLNAIPGVNVDFNFSYKNYPAIIKELGFNGFEQ